MTEKLDIQENTAAVPSEGSSIFNVSYLSVGREHGAAKCAHLFVASLRKRTCVGFVIGKDSSCTEVSGYVSSYVHRENESANR
jgi:hypothetical protein